CSSSGRPSGGSTTRRVDPPTRRSDAVAKAPPVERSRTVGATGATRLRDRKSDLVQVLTWIVVIAFGAYYLLPFYWMIVTALKSTAELGANPPTWFPHHPEWSNFGKAVDVFPFWRYLWNTSIITGLTVLGVALTNPMVAYGFSRIPWPGRDKVFYVVLATV